MSKNAVNNIKMIGKQYVKKKEKTYCLVRKKKADNKKIRGLALLNKIATEGWIWTAFTSRKSTLLKCKNKWWLTVVTA